jgi:hypothetical protein
MFANFVCSFRVDASLFFRVTSWTVGRCTSVTIHETHESKRKAATLKGAAPNYIKPSVAE